MKIIITIFYLFILTQYVSAQADSTDAKLKNILSEKNDIKRVEKLHNFFLLIQDDDPLKNLEIAQHLLLLAQKNSDNHAEAFAICQLGYQSYTIGNITKSLEYGLKALKIAETLNNPELSSIIKNRIAHNYIQEPAKQIVYYKQAYDYQLKDPDYNLKSLIAGNLGRAYLRMQQLDSALFYLQQWEQLDTKTTIKSGTSFTHSSIGDVYAEMKKPILALAYFNTAINEAKISGSARWINEAYNAIAQFYFKENKIDSAKWYAEKAIEAVQKTSFANNVLSPSKLLTDIYRNKNNDSAMKYADMNAAANDNVNSLRTIQQNQLLTFDEDLRQKEIAAERLKADEERRQNIQYALIALGIIIFIILFLLLSRTLIVTEKLISFFAILGLLIIFEFLNLLIHPWLAHFTHESPVLMLLALVAIASLLIPFHHKMEHWIKEKMVEKNKAIRLAAAKKTIEKLGDNQINQK
jgi:tetratricopeptide (TPR) repeat protein